MECSAVYLKACQVPVAHTPCAVAPPELKLVHHVDYLRNGLRQIVAVEQVEVYV